MWESGLDYPSIFSVLQVREADSGTRFFACQPAAATDLRRLSHRHCVTVGCSARKQVCSAPCCEPNCALWSCCCGLQPHTHSLVSTVQEWCEWLSVLSSSAPVSINDHHINHFRQVNKNGCSIMWFDVLYDTISEGIWRLCWGCARSLRSQVRAAQPSNILTVVPDEA
jgi:hypothetical protein